MYSIVSFTAKYSCFAIETQLGVRYPFEHLFHNLSPNVTTTQTVTVLITKFYWITSSCIDYPVRLLGSLREQLVTYKRCARKYHRLVHNRRFIMCRKTSNDCPEESSTVMVSVNLNTQRR